jgi:hypothetical protein
MGSRCIFLSAVFLVLLGFNVAGLRQHAAIQRQTLNVALTHQIDGHSAHIASLLASMRATQFSNIEDAIYQELRTKPSTSLISRTMVKVGTASDGLLECMIDTSEFGVAPRFIRPSEATSPRSIPPRY